ncbi:AfsR/SARP family transcriptional regulator [Streptomyces radiopugnans]|uniref:DNA-binding transcriptional activator of the SARP family n=1 Tax=Streptomyces radiopugnans TaxID=403935 RepID=A0A1H9KMU0_9ACTN|nr:BTAD domain-containing putative transcriptional regulator [Streptomyces radiopugnans]SER00389.1 DNA-binding transcriptional activator of the SARP family [Streptomyces radiopugnans]
MDFKVLGPVTAEVDGRAVPLDGCKQRTVLAALLLAHCRSLTDDRLVALLWGWERVAVRTSRLYTYVSRLRTRIGSGLKLERIGRGYRMDIGDAVFDWDVFRRLAEAGRADLLAGRYAGAERRLAEALALWRGPALRDVTPYLADAEAPGLEEARVSAQENHADAALALGRHADVVTALTGLAAQHPVRERIRGQLMVALYRCGRQAEALTVYEEGRRVLAEELGIDPGPALRTLHQQILRGVLPPPRAPERHSVTLSAPEVRAPHHGGGLEDGLVPVMLPAGAGDFTGRTAETADVLAALHAHQDVLVTGPPGTGKSAFAVRAACRSRAEFPHGLLYADLRSPDGTPRDPAQALGWFLRALGAVDGELPATLDERAHLYRTLMAGRRALVVLDNAADDAQVRPLLPGSDGNRTLVTGIRSTLASLEGTKLVRLGPMDADEARRLLAAVVGEERVAAEPEAAARVVRACDGLPLALRVAGSRLAACQQWRIARLADRLAPEGRRLDELRFGSLDVRGRLRAALDPLDEAARRDCGALAAIGPVPLIPPDAAELLGTSCDEAEELLESLADAGILETWCADGEVWLRYRFTPLMRLAVREEATTRAGGSGPPPARLSAGRPAGALPPGSGSDVGVPFVQPVRQLERAGVRIVCLPSVHQVFDVGRQ